MSTKIEGVSGGNSLWLYGCPNDEVTVQTRDSGAVVPRDEFLAAVAAELDVIIIPKTDLPTVTYRDDQGGYVEVEAIKHGDNVVAGYITQVPPIGDRGYRYHMAIVAQHVALAEYANASPVDEVDVETLVQQMGQMPAALFSEAEDGYFETTQREIARRLLATGRVSVTK